MLRAPSTTDAPVVGRTPVPRHDPQRPADSIAEPLEDLDELGVDDDGPAVLAGELTTGEVP